MNRGAFAAVMKDQSVLLVRSRTAPQYEDYWSFPGGVVEGEESLRQGAQREVLEETAVRCEIGEIIEVVDNNEFDIQVTIFLAAYVEGVLAPDSHEIAEAGWFTIQEALGLPLAYNLRSILEQLST